MYPFVMLLRIQQLGPAFSSALGVSLCFAPRDAAGETGPGRAAGGDADLQHAGLSAGVPRLDPR